jgi:putative aldouronate transport system substrate-binding protein
VNDQKKVEFGATNPRIVDVMEYMNKLYKEKLIPDEVFTDVWDTYVSKFRSIPPVNGLQGSYFLEDYHQPFFAALMPVAGPGVTKPIFRSQPIRVEKNEFTVMKKFAYPEVAVRFIDNFADDELSLVMSYGIEKQADGTYKQYTVDGTKPHNFLASLIPARASAKVTWSGAQGTRAKIADQYAAFTWPQVRHFPLVRYTPQEIEQISVLETEIRTYAKTTLAKWIVNGGARSEWNAYVQQLDKLGLPKLMVIYQAAYDRFNK